MLVLEASLLSTPESFITMKVNEGSKAAKLLLKLKKDIDSPISAILTLNTCAHTIGAAGVGAEAEKVFGAEYFAIISAVLTLAILILSELIPKSIGAHHWRNLVGVTAYTVNFMVIVTFPIVYVYRKMMSKFSSHEDSTISKEEVSAMVTIGAEEGVFNSSQNRMLQNIIAIEKFKVKDIMTPRSVCFTVDIDSLVSDFPSNIQFSRIPVYQYDKDNIVGIIYKDEILKFKAESKNSLNKIKDTNVENKFVLATKFDSVMSLFEKFRSTSHHMAIVVGEYGTFEGVVTLEDVMEAMLGVEICDESDKIVDMQEYARNKWNERRSKLNQL
jgi:CBS domain containing-hemolysin-like protein